MSQTIKTNRKEGSKKVFEQEQATPSVRRRSPTLLKMQWLAERVRKCERIRKQVEAGTYEVDSQVVAKSLLGIE